MSFYLFFFYTKESYTDHPNFMFVTNCEIPVLEKVGQSFKSKTKLLEM